MNQPTAENLTITEHDERASLEKIIQRGVQTFAEVGRALLRIRDAKLYRDTHATFAEYCERRWGFTRPTAYRLISAAEVMGDLSPMGDIQPETERQARPLARLVNADERRHAWQEAVQTAPSGKVTAAHVEDVVRRHLEPEAETEPEPEPMAWQKPVVAQPTIASQVRERAPATASPAQPSPMAVHFSSESPEHYTPKHIIERVIQAMEGIDLDPCSNGGPVPNVPAITHYTEADDGLTEPWFGRVYLNPPYGDQIARWTERLVDEYEDRHITEAIALLPARTDTAWFSRLWDYPICFVRGRLKFGDATNSAPFPSAVIYFGERVEEFGQAFRDLGPIVVKLIYPWDVTSD